MLVHAAAFHDHDVARLPLNMPPVMDVVAAALQDVEDRAVEVAVLLPVGAGRVDLDMGLDRLRDVGGAGCDDMLAVERRAALPGMMARGIDARLLQQALVDVAIGAFERPHEDALFRPALPLAFLVLGRGLVVALSGGSFVKSCHTCIAPCLASPQYIFGRIFDGEPAPIPDQVRDRLSPENALPRNQWPVYQVGRSNK